MHELLNNIQPYKYVYVSSFENLSSTTQNNLIKWMNANGTQCFIFSALYVIFIFLGKWFMQQRERFELRTSLVLWSGTLSVFSILGSLRCVPEMVHIIYNYGFHATLVDCSFYEGVSGFWSILFIWSKPLELGDTVLIVLRKQPVIFLHWYHHITVMLYCWLFYPEGYGTARWFICMNYTVHAIMYTYYTLRAAKFILPRIVNIFVTSMQIAQMLMGLFIFLYLYWCRYAGDKSLLQIRDKVVHYGFLMYLSYFVLFANFFFNTYVKPQPRVAPSPSSKVFQVGLRDSDLTKKAV